MTDKPLLQHRGNWTYKPCLIGYFQPQMMRFVSLFHADNEDGRLIIMYAKGDFLLFRCFWVFAIKQLSDVVLQLIILALLSVLFERGSSKSGRFRKESQVQNRFPSGFNPLLDDFSSLKF